MRVAHEKETGRYRILTSSQNRSGWELREGFFIGSNIARQQLRIAFVPDKSLPCDNLDNYRQFSIPFNCVAKRVLDMINSEQSISEKQCMRLLYNPTKQKIYVLGSPRFQARLHEDKGFDIKVAIVNITALVSIQQCGVAFADRAKRSLLIQVPGGKLGDTVDFHLYLTTKGWKAQNHTVRFLHKATAEE